MQNIFYSSKDEISNRILKNARDYWGVKNVADFDPMVKLLIEALSTELFNVSNEVKNLENRVLDKIAQVLASDLLISALPAHAVLHATPVEETEIISGKDQFFYRKKVQDQGDEGQAVDIFFSPLKPVKLFNAEVAYMASGVSLFRFDDQNNKVFVGQTLQGSRIENNAAYIGVRVPAGLSSCQGMNFYFDWRNYRVDSNIYDLIALSKWFSDGRPVNTALHKFYLDAEKKMRSPFESRDLLNLLEADIDAVYANRFLTIEEDAELGAPPVLQNYPAEFERLFRQENLQSLSVPVLWFKVVFPAAITAAMLDELHVSVNAFPVVNKRIHDLKYRLKMMTDIIPLKLADQDHFLGVQGLTDNIGTVYTEIPYINEDRAEAGSFAIRYGGTERFDSRNAREMIDYLFELLRDEKAAFSAYGADFLDHTLKELEQNISLIERKTRMQPGSAGELLNYIIVKPVKEADIMFTEFWTTNAETGNQIRSGSRLQAFETAKINPGSLFLLSNSQGGRSRLSTGNRVQAFKYGLTSGDRVVTRADIVNFCFYELGDNISAVAIKKGLQNSGSVNEGFIKTTDIIITAAADNRLSPDEWESVLGTTRSKLQIRSVMNVHYRLMLA